MTKISTRLKKSWKQARKEYLGPGILLFIIGFSIGPMITEKVYDTREFSSSIEFNPHVFKPIIQINFGTVNQPLDPGAIQIINYTTKIVTQNDNFTIVSVLTKQNWFFDFGTKVDTIANKFMLNNTPTNDTEFKQDYQSLINEKFSEGGLLYSFKLNKSQKEDISLYKLPENGAFSIGFILSDWNSSQFWNETNVYYSIHVSIEQSYQRYINYFLGIIIETIGFVLVIAAFVPVASLLRKLKNPK